MPCHMYGPMNQSELRSIVARAPLAKVQVSFLQRHTSRSALGSLAERDGKNARVMGHEGVGVLEEGDANQEVVHPDVRHDV
jgi:hypothetical protein